MWFNTNFNFSFYNPSTIDTHSFFGIFFHMNFEDKLKRLEEIVHLLEDEKTPLEEALKLFEEGNALFKELKAYLKKAEEKIEILIKDQMGTLTTDEDEEVS